MKEKNKPNSFFKRHWVLFLVIFLVLVIGGIVVGFLVYIDSLSYKYAPPINLQVSDSDPIYEKHLQITENAKADFTYMNSLIQRWNANLNKIDDGTKVDKAIAIANEFTEFIYTDFTQHVNTIDGDFYNNNANYLNQKYGIQLDIESQLEEAHEKYYDLHEQMNYQAQRMKENRDLIKQQEELTKMYLQIFGAFI